MARRYAAWRTWREGAVERGRAVDAARRVLQRLCAQSLARGWTTLCDYVDACHQRRGAMEAVLCRLQNQASVRAFGAWRANAEAVGVAQRTIRNAVGRWLNKAMWRGLMAWRSSCVLVRHLKLSFRRLARHARLAREAQASGLSVFEKSVRRLRMWHASRAFRQFVAVVTLEMRLVHALKKMRSAELGRCVETWRYNALDAVESASAYELAFRRLRHMGASKGFAAWAENAAAAARSADLLESSVRRMRGVLFSGAWNAWREHSDNVRTMARIAKRFNSKWRAAAHAWEAWLSLCERRHEKAASLRKVLNALRLSLTSPDLP